MNENCLDYGMEQKPDQSGVRRGLEMSWWKQLTFIVFSCTLAVMWRRVLETHEVKGSLEGLLISSLFNIVECIYIFMVDIHLKREMFNVKKKGGITDIARSWFLKSERK